MDRWVEKGNSVANVMTFQDVRSITKTKRKFSFDTAWWNLFVNATRNPNGNRNQSNLILKEKRKELKKHLQISIKNFNMDWQKMQSITDWTLLGQGDAVSVDETGCMTGAAAQDKPLGRESSACAPLCRVDPSTPQSCWLRCDALIIISGVGLVNCQISAGRVSCRQLSTLSPAKRFTFVFSELQKVNGQCFNWSLPAHLDCVAFHRSLCWNWIATDSQLLTLTK